MFLRSKLVELIASLCICVVFLGDAIQAACFSSNRNAAASLKGTQAHANYLHVDLAHLIKVFFFFFLLAISGGFFVLY